MIERERKTHAYMEERLKIEKEYECVYECKRHRDSEWADKWVDDWNR